MSEFQEETISDEEKLQIAQHFLLSSPPYQFQEVLTDVKHILPEGLLTDPLAAGIARAYNIKNGRVVTAPSGSKVVVCKAGEIDATHYIDSKTGTAFGLDHMTMTTAPAEISSNADEVHDSVRRFIQTAIDQYVGTKFVAEQSSGGVFVKDGKIVIVIVGERPNLRNFWSGRWASNWSVSLDGGNVASVTGDIKVHAHYFEDGNVQLQSHKAVPKSEIRYTGDSHLAAQIVAHIKATETSLQSGLEEMYGSMDEETFRAMRRTMPITRTKMDWNLNAVRMTRQIQRK